MTARAGWCTLTCALIASLFLTTGWLAQTASASPRYHRVHGRIWHTCKRYDTRMAYGMQIDNDHFAGAPGPSCITVVGRTVTIGTSYQPGGGVVAYDAIRFGWYPWNNKRAYGLPAPAGRVHTQLRVRGSGGPGDYLYDADIWLSRTGQPGPLRHIREIVIANRWQGSWHTRTGHLVRIGRRRWHVTAWMTGQGAARHLLIRFVARRPSPGATIRLAAFLRIARRHQWIAGWMTVDSASYAPECRQGCRGLTYSMKASP